MTTFLDLKNEVQALVIDLPPTVLSAVPTLVNRAIRSLQNEYNYRVMETTLSFVTVEGSQDLGTSSVFKEYRDRGAFLLRQLGRAKPLAISASSNFNQAVLNNTDYPGEPAFVRNGISIITGLVTFRVAPYPDTNSDWDDGNYRISIPIYSYSADLVADGDTNWFTNNASEYIVYKATAEAFARDWDYDSMALWLQRADEKKKEIKKADKTNRLSGVNELVPLWRGANQPISRR